MQTDPIGYADGMNWYNYVHGDPVNRFDTMGTDGDPISIPIYGKKDPFSAYNRFENAGGACGLVGGSYCSPQVVPGRIDGEGYGLLQTVTLSPAIIFGVPKIIDLGRGKMSVKLVFKAGKHQLELEKPEGEGKVERNIGIFASIFENIAKNMGANFGVILHDSDPDPDAPIINLFDKSNYRDQANYVPNGREYERTYEPDQFPGADNGGNHSYELKLVPYETTADDTDVEVWVKYY
jgi:hypothetical protein